MVNKIKTAREFLRREGVDLEKLNYAWDGGRYLDWYIRDLNYSAVMALIIAGADVNAKSPGLPDVPLWTAINWEGGDLKMVKLLVAAGADINICDIATGTSFVETARDVVKNEKIAVYLESVQNNPYKTPLYTGLPADFAREFLRRLDVDVANLNHYDNDHGTYLWAAVQDENYAMAAILIIAGADVNAVDPDGGTETAIHTAAEGDLKMVKMLVAAGADLTARCHAYNYTPLETARHKVKNAEIAAYLESVQNNPLHVPPHFTPEDTD